MSRRVYVAASWRTPGQPVVVEKVREWGHEVYDFRDHGFGWKQIDPSCGPGPWPSEKYLDVLRHPIARQGFWRDMGALAWCDTLILVMPAGRSACAEFGWAVGQRKRTAVVIEYQQEPDLMFAMADLVTPFYGALEDWLNECSGVVE